jgi:hypothetical protein
VCSTALAPHYALHEGRRACGPAWTSSQYCEQPTENC